MTRIGGPVCEKCGKTINILAVIRTETGEWVRVIVGPRVPKDYRLKHRNCHE